LRATSRELYRKALDCFEEAGVELVNVHPDQRVPMHSRDAMRKMNAEAIELLAQDAAQRGITIMVENLDRNFSGVDDLKVILDDVRDARFHLDVGHANLRLGLGEPNRTAALLEAFGERLAHVHLSDNRGGAEDLHLPLGAGSIDWKNVVRMLKGVGWDGTVTLEVFSREREYLLMSRRLWLKLWSEN
jgi:sugar phosphate isomerase/epimerase